MNRRGNDVGTSYRSAIFASGLWPGRIGTEVTAAGDCWEAEPEHQDCLEHHPGGYACHYVRRQWKLPRRQLSTSN